MLVISNSILINQQPPELRGICALSGKILHYVIPAKDCKVCMRGSAKTIHHRDPSNLDSSQLLS
jgi:hypothetical protein